MTGIPLQRPYDQALQRGLDTLNEHAPSPGRLNSLGATLTGSTIRLPALNRHLSVDLEQRNVLVDGSFRARPVWAVLAVHYLCAENLDPDTREVSFSYFEDCHSYLSVFGKRITARFLATSGRTAEEFARLGEPFAAAKVHGSGTGYRFDVLPRVPITLIRYEGDDEVPAGASIIYRADAERLLPAEDRVVAVELLLDILSGKPMTESGGYYAQRN
ncbi:MAG: DUF3786 domain-containing protein [bacterium]